METVQAKNRDEWRAWLSANHDKVNEIWLVYNKKGSGKASVAYEASVEEALCFGWIEVAKRPETRAKRIGESIQLLMQGKKLGLR